MQGDGHEKLKPGARVKVTQQIAGGNYTWTTDIRGTVVAFQQKPTGSWFAHSKDDKLWLDRLLLRKENGEMTTLNLDDYTFVEVEAGGGTDGGDGGGAGAGAGAKKNESDLPL
jgi:hypothetical protein